MPRVAYEQLILSGGSVKGLAYAGCLEYLEEMNMVSDIKNLLGCSIGSLSCLLINLRYSSKQLQRVFNRIDFDDLKDINNIKTIATSFGIGDGSNLEKFIKRFIKHKGYNPDITFLDLYKSTGVKLSVVVTNISIDSTEIFNYENTPNLPVWKGVRASSNLPMVFAPVKINGYLYIDGGVSCNIPLSYADTSDDKKSLCIYINPQATKLDENSCISRFIFKVIRCPLRVTERRDFKAASENQNIKVIKLEIPARIVTSLDFDLSIEQREALYSLGYEQIKNGFKKI